jgi:ribose transport system substrate-binding protein
VSRSGTAESLVRACKLLQLWRYEGELLRLRDVVQRSNLHKTTAHRLLQSLAEGGLVERIGTDEYRSLIRPLSEVRHRIGYAGQTRDSTFAHLVSDSIIRGAMQHNVDVVMLNNRYSSRTALRNTETLIRDRVDLVIEFQKHDTVAAAVAHRFLEAGIPVIAVEIPHPGATYFGADNYQAGLIGGRALGRWARQEWRDPVDEILCLEERIAGPLPGARVKGMLNGVLETLPTASSARKLLFDGKGQFEGSMKIVRRHLRFSVARRVLVLANNDPSALGALRAFEESGRPEVCAVMSQNALPEACAELRRKGTRLIGSVAYFPERYGDEIIPLALSIMAGKPLPSAIFTRHQLVMSSNVDRIYPPELKKFDPTTGGLPAVSSGAIRTV